MEEGSLRADANVSINFPGKGLGKKVEIKNLNSSRFVKLGLNYEIARQGAILDRGQEVVQETRLWNENRDQTEPMRQKENAQDYRYFPEPDLPVFTPDQAFLRSVEDAIPELPQARIKRIKGEYTLGEEQAELIADEKAEADYFEEAVAGAVEQGLDKTEAGLKLSRWLLSEIRHILSREGLSPSAVGALKLTPRRLASLAVLSARGKVSGKNAKQTLELVQTEDRDPEVILRERGWEQLSDPARIAQAADAVYAAEPDLFAEARSALAGANPKRGRSLRAYLVGKVLERTGGRADPQIAGQRIEELIAGG
jgi:aspartyl-tRNA(Asn)/glutamyl-tRNA(Gln) amidotransferase subunit B